MHFLPWWTTGVALPLRTSSCARSPKVPCIVALVMANGEAIALGLGRETRGERLA
jgi:hypothetical protein